jgi:cytochrome c peroxidase
MKIKAAVLIFFSIVFLSAVFQACEKDIPIPTTNPEPPVYNIAFTVPEGWPQPVYNFQDNTLTTEGFKLGRKLFYEEKLSRDNTISCGSCHQDFVAFANAEHALSHGIEGRFTKRNAPALFNLNWHTKLMWDGGVNHIEVQPLVPITDLVEMDETMNNVVSKLSADPTYQKMFEDAFGDPQITSERTLKAFAQFMGMLVSSNSKYDKYVRGEAGGEFTASELNGLHLFRAKCASCHVPPLFTDFSFRNKGLSINPTLKDSGRAHITGKPEDRYKFKVPSLRNIAYTGPYMHDGRFKTLSQCLDYFSTGMIQAVANDPALAQTLDPLLSSGIPMTNDEKSDMLIFLNTLTDITFIKDKRFSDPH